MNDYQFMIFSLCSIFDTDIRSAADTSSSEGGWWVRFGDDMLVYAADAKWEAVSAKLTGFGAFSREVTGKVTKGKMHLVVQKGRLFQQEHPNVRVILDKGRYLVVEMDKAAARKLNGRKVPCFHIEPLEENSIVFETRRRAAQAQSRDAAIEAVLCEVNQAAFEANLAQLVSYPTRLSTSPGYQEAAEWASAELSAMGYSTTLEPVTLGTSGKSTNVIATRNGGGPSPRQQILIVAHLDSINHSDGPSANAPGADDNGSGSAGLLTMASALAAFNFDHDLTFVLFGGEEQGLHGSSQYVAGLSAAEKSNICAVINMDMIGSVNTVKPRVMLEGAALSQSLIDDLTAAAAAYINLDVQVSLNPFASDHVPFIEAGIQAVLASDDQPAAATENSVNLSSHYHKLFAQYARLHRDGRLQAQRLFHLASNESHAKTRGLRN